MDAPNKLLLKANAEKRVTFVVAYVAMPTDAAQIGAKISFVDFRADVELRAKWVWRGEPALVDTNRPKFDKKATYYSAACLETGEVASMPVLGNTNATTSVAFLQQLRAMHAGPLPII